MSLEISIRKKLSSFELEIAFSIGDAEALALLGASGSGKSMLLKCIAGVERPDAGRIVLDGRVLFDSDRKICLTPRERRTGLLFQNYALFPNMTVYQNIFHSIRRERYSTLQIKQKADNAVSMMHLDAVRDSPVTAISGGEMQRTALARILVNDAELLMLDEPLSALDEHLKFSLEMELRDVIGNFGGNVLLVTHDRDQAYRFGSKIALVNRGKIEKIDSPANVFANPETVDGARITGVKNIAPASVENGRIRILGWGLDLACDRLPAGCRSVDIKYAGIRMNDLKPAAVVPEFEDGAVFNFKIADVLSNVFSYTVKLYSSTAGAEALPLYWQVSKQIWEPCGTDNVDLYLRRDAVMPLKQEERSQ